MVGQLLFLVIMMSPSIVMGQHSSSLCSSLNSNKEECILHHISDKLEQMSALDRKLDNTVQQIAETIQSGTGQPNSNSDLSCPESLDNAATDSTLPENCLDVYNNGNHISGTYTVYEPLAVSKFRSNNRRTIRVFCDMELNLGGPGWMLFQRRQDGSVSFNQTWAQYRDGFGDLAGEHWLGNDNIALIAGGSTTYELRVDLMNWASERRFAKYNSFKIQTEAFKYRLSLGGYFGDAGDSMSEHNNMYFSTPDMDNDSVPRFDCAERYYWAGWWYSDCGNAFLNNPYRNSSTAYINRGIFWISWLGSKYSMRQVQMKLRPVIV